MDLRDRLKKAECPREGKQPTDSPAVAAFGLCYR